MYITVQNLTKHFKIKVRDKGLVNAIKAFVKPKYRTIKAVDDISFGIKKGEILGFIGPNGAGKSTTIKMLCGIMQPDGGSCMVGNINPFKNRKEYVAHIGVVFGVGIGGINTFQDEVSNWALTGLDTPPKFNPFFIPKMIADIASGHISIMYGFHGPNFTTTSACASSSNAIADAFNYIRLGKANVIVAGGAEAAICPGGVGGFNAMHALSTRNDDPARASRPFSASRDGFIMAEGAGCLILEELEHAKARGAKIYAELVGAGLSADAHHLTASHPEGLGAKLVMMNALEDAGMKPSDIDYINAHATSTLQGDMYEAMAIGKLFEGERALVSSTKSMTGHECWMAGASEIVYSIIMMQNNFVAPNINLQECDEHSAKLNLTAKTVDTEVNTVLSNSFGFGGTNSALIIKKI